MSKVGFPTVLILLVLAACQPGPVYENYLVVGKQGWLADSTARFEVKIEDTTARYVVVFNLRANNNYPFANLYLFRKIYSEEGLEYQDTANLKLADPYGRWLGEGVGPLKTFSRPYRRQPLKFQRSGTYTFEFSQAMRQDPLTGVESIGLTLYRETDG